MRAPSPGLPGEVERPTSSAATSPFSGCLTCPVRPHALRRGGAFGGGSGGGGVGAFNGGVFSHTSACGGAVYATGVFVESDYRGEYGVKNEKLEDRGCDLHKTQW